MKLPAFPKVSKRTLHAIAERQGLGKQTFSRLPEVGIFNAIYADRSSTVISSLAYDSR
jgi:hypothetical protein